MSTWALTVTTMTSLTRRRFISATVRSKLVAPSLGSSLMSMPNWPTNSGVEEFVSASTSMIASCALSSASGDLGRARGTHRPGTRAGRHLVGVDVEPAAAAQADAEVQVPADGALDRAAVAGLQRQARDAEVDRQLAADAPAELAHGAVGVEVVLAALGADLALAELEVDDEALDLQHRGVGRAGGAGDPAVGLGLGGVRRRVRGDGRVVVGHGGVAGDGARPRRTRGSPAVGLIARSTL